MATEKDVFASTVFLLSDASRQITGQNIVVDGGLSVQWCVLALACDCSRNYPGAHRILDVRDARSDGLAIGIHG